MKKNEIMKNYNIPANRLPPTYELESMEEPLTCASYRWLMFFKTPRVKTTHTSFMGWDGYTYDGDSYHTASGSKKRKERKGDQFNLSSHRKKRNKRFSISPVDEQHFLPRWDELVYKWEQANPIKPAIVGWDLYGETPEPLDPLPGLRVMERTGKARVLEMSIQAGNSGFKRFKTVNWETTGVVMNNVLNEVRVFEPHYATGTHKYTFAGHYNLSCIPAPLTRLDKLPHKVPQPHARGSLPKHEIKGLFVCLTKREELQLYLWRWKGLDDIEQCELLPLSNYNSLDLSVSSWLYKDHTWEDEDLVYRWGKEQYSEWDE